MSIEPGMLVTCCMQCAMSVSTVLWCGCVPWWKVCVCYCDVFSFAYVYVILDECDESLFLCVFSAYGGVVEYFLCV